MLSCRLIQGVLMTTNWCKTYVTSRSSSMFGTKSSSCSHRGPGGAPFQLSMARAPWHRYRDTPRGRAPLHRLSHLSFTHRGAESKPWAEARSKLYTCTQSQASSASIYKLLQCINSKLQIQTCKLIPSRDRLINIAVLNKGQITTGLPM